MGFRSPPTLEPWRIHCPGACLTPFVALSGFLILSAPCSPPYLPTLFHAGSVLGVSPFRAFSSQGAVPPLGGRCPPGVHRIPASPPDTDRPRETGKPAVRRRRVRDVSAGLPSVSSDLCRWYGPGRTVGQANRPPGTVGTRAVRLASGPCRHARPKPFAVQEPGARRVVSRCRLDPGAEAPQPTAAAMTPCGRSWAVRRGGRCRSTTRRIDVPCRS
jgi:hypothetical protein